MKTQTACIFFKPSFIQLQQNFIFRYMQDKTKKWALVGASIFLAVAAAIGTFIRKA
jgi:hypothetical protein